MRNSVKKNTSLTKDQEEALSKIKKKLFGGDGVATLKGYAGTGKTFMLREIIEELSDDINEVYLMAPTHKAAEVLSRKTNKSVRTVHSAFGLRPVWDGDGGYKFKQTGEEPMKFIYRSLAAVDEASMINDKLYNCLIKAKQQYDLKLLFVGDPAQLPPVNHQTSPSLSHDGYKLTNIVRQGDQNPVLESSMNVRKNGANWRFEQKTNSSGEGVYVYNDVSDFFQNAINDFDTSEYRNTGDFARVLAYKNETVAEYNNLFRSTLYEDDDLQFVDGEWLVAVEPWTPISSSEDYNPIIQNSEEVVVESRDIVKTDGWFTWELFVSSYPGSNDKRKIIVLHESEEDRYTKKLENLKQRAKKKQYMWAEYYELKEKFAKVDYSFSMTVHRAQGSTFERVYVDKGDIMNCYKRDERDALMYVAATRPSNRLVVLNDY